MMICTAISLDLVNANDYLGILANHPIVQTLFPDGSLIFQVSNAQIHTADVNQNCLFVLYWILLIVLCGAL